MVLHVEGFDAGFGGFGLVEVLVDGRRLRLPKPHEVDDVGEDLDQAVVGGFEEVGEGKVQYAALEFGASQDEPKSRQGVVGGTRFYLEEQSPQRDIKAQ